MIDLGEAPLQRKSKLQSTTIQSDPVSDFLNAMAEHGLAPTDLVVSGELVRFDVDRKGDKAGWYAFHLDGIPAGSFGSWKTGLRETWCAVDSRDMDDTARVRHLEFIDKVRSQREALKNDAHQKAKHIANEIWSRATDVQAHPYLEKKGVQSHFLRAKGQVLLVPVLNESGEIVNLQRILSKKNEDGKDKFLLKGGQKRGCFFQIDTPPGVVSDTVYVCEGYATGASIHDITGDAVYMAIDSGNIESVAKIVRKKRPEAQIVICGDNDRFTAGNPGIEAAKKAAAAVGGKAIWPVFDDIQGGNDPAKKLTDFNDLVLAGGLKVAKTQVLSITPRKGKLIPLSEAGTRLKGRLLARPKPLEFIFKYHNQGFIPKGVIGVLTATGGTGKTFILLSLAMAGACGGYLGPINAPRPLKTLVVIGEDTQDELERRLWDLGGGSFHENLHAVSVFGQAGPFMRLEGANPVLSDTWYWLDETIQQHPGLELLIFDPKSRFYGLDENNSDHATQWIQALEILALKHNLTILFSHHTAKQTSDKISQNMSRGSSAIVDGCRWQGGMARMDEKLAQKYGIEKPRDYVVLDVPKSNYAPDVPSIMIFKRGLNGVLEYTDLGSGLIKEMAVELLEKLKLDTEEYTKNELIKETKGCGITREMKAIFPGFKRVVDMPKIIDCLVAEGKLSLEQIGSGRSSKQIIFIERV